jgi:hypothetical protein
MDKDVISAKLETLRRCVQRIKDKTPDSPASLQSDVDLRTSFASTSSVQSRYVSIWHLT